MSKDEARAKNARRETLVMVSLLVILASAFIFRS
jgi:hypothetical protein